jgi:hypothetical protein
MVIVHFSLSILKFVTIPLNVGQNMCGCEKPMSIKLEN